jgi:hypothetical protein
MDVDSGIAVVGANQETKCHASSGVGLGRQHGRERDWLVAFDRAIEPSRPGSPPPGSRWPWCDLGVAWSTEWPEARQSVQAREPRSLDIYFGASCRPWNVLERNDRWPAAIHTDNPVERTTNAKIASVSERDGDDDLPGFRRGVPKSDPEYDARPAATLTAQPRSKREEPARTASAVPSCASPRVWAWGVRVTLAASGAAVARVKAREVGAVTTVHWVRYAISRPDDVAVGPTVKRVARSSANDVIVTRAARDAIVAVSAPELVRPQRAFERVIAAIANEDGPA